MNSCYRRHSTLSPPPPLLLCIENYVLFPARSPEETNGLSPARCIIHSKAKNEYVFPPPAAGSRSNFDDVSIARFNETPEQLSDVKTSFCLVGRPELCAKNVTYSFAVNVHDGFCNRYRNESAPTVGVTKDIEKIGVERTVIRGDEWRRKKNARCPPRNGPVVVIGSSGKRRDARRKANVLFRHCCAT